MTFLPIVQRELRVAARRNFTWWVRVMAAGMAVFIAGWILLATQQFAAPDQVGRSLFGVLTGYLFLLCLLAGPFLTADSLSREKREGTLGLLFLTDLRGYDVVLGKFLAHGLSALYALLAVLPVLSLPLLLGGVDFATFARVALALFGALLFSLAAGIYASAISFTQMESVWFTLLLLAGMCFAAIFPPPACLGPLDALLASFAVSLGSDPLNYGTGLTTTLTGIGLLLWIASVSLPTSWQTTAVSTVASLSEENLRVVEVNKAITIQGIPARVGEDDPVAWYIKRRSNGRLLVTPMNFLIGCLTLYALLLMEDKAVGLLFAFPTVLLLFFLKICMAADACRFFGNARTDGVMEILLTTPLDSDKLVSSVWRGLEQSYSKGLFIIAACLGSVSMVFAFADKTGWLLYFGNMAVKLLVDFYTIGWVGMWLSLSCRNPEAAFRWTVLLVLVLPTLLIPLPDIVMDIALLAWAKNKMGAGVHDIIRRQMEPRAGVEKAS